MTSAAYQPPHARSPSSAVLGPRLRLVCHAVRFAAVGWIVWGFVAVVVAWSDPAALARGYGHLLKLDLTGHSSTQHVASFAVMLVDLAAAALVVVTVWRLFGHFLAGRILSLDAVDEMQCLGWAGIMAMGTDLLARPAVAAILSSHVEGVPTRFHFWGQPQDLLHILMALFIVVLASVFRHGVAIADEHRQIV